MIAYLSGKITFKSPTHILLETGGLGYMVKISLNTFEKIQSLESCVLHTTLIVKNENQSVTGFDLYGFHGEAEKELFEKLISVSGVGAATARMMLSAFKPAEIKSAILTENEPLIQSVKGIGPKMAKRLIFELKDKIGQSSAASNLSGTPNNRMREEALFALLALGFNRQAIEKVLAKLLAAGGQDSVEALIKEALKLM